MRWMTRLAVMAILAVAATGCAALTKTVPSSDMATMEKAAFAAKSAYAVALVGMVQINKMPRCEIAPAPCVHQSVVDTMRKLDLAADQATQAAEDLVRSQRGSPSVVQLGVEAATKAVAAFSGIVNIYKEK